MALKFKQGERFPPGAQLTGIAGERVTIEEVAAGSPLILTFYRGYW